MNQSEIEVPVASAKVFTLRSANAMLPLVKSIVMDIVELTGVISQTMHRLKDMDEFVVDREEDDLYSSELTAIREATDRQSDQVQVCVEELEELSVVARSLSEGHVDFPAMRDNEEVCLCWRLGDDEVLFWHRQSEDCSQRRLVGLTLIRQSARVELSSRA